MCATIAARGNTGGFFICVGLGSKNIYLTQLLIAHYNIGAQAPKIWF